MDILIVEDNDSDYLLLSYALESSWLEPPAIRRAETFVAAEVAMAKQRPDLVFLDMGLPDVSGTGGLLHLLKVFPEVPVVVCTGLAPDDLEEHAIGLGAQAYLPKACITPEVVGRVVRCAIARHRYRSALLGAIARLIQVSA